MTLKLSEEDFLKSFEFCPRVAINILVKKKTGEVLLAKRSHGAFIGKWYFPGSYLLKDETFSECFERIGKEELGITLSFKKARFMGIYEDLFEDIRGHTLDMIYEITISSSILQKLKSIEKTKFFNSLPKNIFLGHNKILNSLGYKYTSQHLIIV